MSQEIYIPQSKSNPEELRSQRQQKQFLQWLCGEEVEFPFFKDFKEISGPLRFVATNEKYLRRIK